MNTETETREPFDLDRALAGEAVETRDGRKVTELKLFQEIERPVAAVIEKGRILSWSKSGKYYNEGEESHIDLFMSPKPKVIRYLWVNKSTGLLLHEMFSENELLEEFKYNDIVDTNLIKIPGTATEFLA